MVRQTVEEKRPSTKSLACPECGCSIEFWHTSGMSGCFPHFYCGACSNVIYRSKDHDLIVKEGASESVLAQILNSLPNCSCGESFVANSYPRCPHCGHAFPHQNTAIQRLTDPHLILIQGAVFDSD